MCYRPPLARTYGLKLLAFLQKKGTNNKHHLEGKLIPVPVSIPNKMNSKELAVIPAGSVIEVHFTGDFGMYAYVDVGGRIHKIKIDLGDIHLLDWSDFQREINACQISQPRSYTETELFRRGETSLADAYERQNRLECRCCRRQCRCCHCPC